MATNIQLPAELGSAYKSAPQKIRVITEHWALDNIFCPACSRLISAKPLNHPATDFYCATCQHAFELKSTRKFFGKKLVDGAYASMASRIRDSTQPNLLLLAYNDYFQVTELRLIPKFFLTLSIVEKRKPLSPSARRHGWIGCNLLIGSIPADGQIIYVQNAQPHSPGLVRSQWQQSRFVETVEPDARGWLVAVMSCIRELGKPRFTLQDVYLFEKELQTRFPKNQNVRPKIRQQLQVLRDKGWLIFSGAGVYQLA